MLFILFQNAGIEQAYADSINRIRAEKSLQPLMVFFGKVPTKGEGLEKVQIFNFRGAVKSNMGKILQHMEKLITDTTFDRLYIQYIPRKKSLKIAFARTKRKKNIAVDIDSFEKKVFESLNDYRSRHGRTTLLWDENLHRLSREHSQDMSMMGRLSHRNFDRRFSRSGYSRCVENLAMAPASYTPRDVIRLWSGSPQHRKNMLERGLTHGAIGADTSRGYLYITFMGCGE